ncbi:MAG: bacterioferritin [Acidobacteriia bacterium]|nr:bacterioferritin [Terriglobia bacterium]
MRLEKSLRLEIVHEVIGVIRGLMAFRAPRLAKEQLLAAKFRRIRPFGIEFPIHAELRSRGKVQQFLKLGHGVHLAPAVENVHALLLRDHGSPSKYAASQYVEGKSLLDMVWEDLVAERIAVESYNEIIRYLGNDDPTTRIAMEQILAKEEEHADDMKKLLETLSKDERRAEHS